MITLNENEILVLQQRYCSHSMPGYQSNLPLEIGSIVTAPDWKPESSFSGLHGMPWGEGSLDYFLNYEDSTFVLTAVDPSNDFMRCDGSLDIYKFKSGRVEFVGNFTDALELLKKYAPANTRIVYSNQTAKQKAVQAAGDKSTQTAMRGSMQIAGQKSTQKAGMESIQKAEYSSIQTAGSNSYQEAQNCSTQTAGQRSIQTSGHESTQVSGDQSYQESGINSIQIAGYGSTQRAGDHSCQDSVEESVQIIGDLSYQRAGIGSIQISYWLDSNKSKKSYSKKSYRIITEVEANKWYFTKNGKWILQDPPKNILDIINKQRENYLN